MQETQVQSPGQEDPLEEGTVTHSSILAGKSHGQRNLVGPQSMGSQRPKHSWRDLARMITAGEKGSLASFHLGHSNFIPVLCKALGWALVIQRWGSTWRGRSMSSSSWFLKCCLLGRSQPKLDGRPEIWPQFHSVGVIGLCQDHLTSVFP